jgi:hypothetical protein
MVSATKRPIRRPAPTPKACHRVEHRGSDVVVVLGSLEGCHPATLDPFVSFRFPRGLAGVVVLVDTAGAVAGRRGVGPRGCSAGNFLRQLSH